MPKTVTAVVLNSQGGEAESVAAALVQESAWFECEPRPDATYAFTVKVDRKRTLASCIAEVGPMRREE